MTRVAVLGSGSWGTTFGVVLLEATTAIVDALTGLLEQIRGEHAPAERWDPRSHDQPLTGDWRRGAPERAADRGEAL